MCSVLAALETFDTAGTPADLKADIPVVERNRRGGARTFGFLSSRDASFNCGLAFSSDSLRLISRRWRRPNGAPVGGGWFMKRLMVVDCDFACGFCATRFTFARNKEIILLFS